MSRELASIASEIDIAPLTFQQSRQLIKVVIVILRDRSPLRFHEITLQASYCWHNTEPLDAALEALKDE